MTKNKSKVSIPEIFVMAALCGLFILIGIQAIDSYNKGGEPPCGYGIETNGERWRFKNEDGYGSLYDFPTRRGAVNDAWRWKREHQPWVEEKPKPVVTSIKIEDEQPVELPDGYSIAFNGSEYRFHDRRIGISTPRRSYKSTAMNANFYETASRFHLDKSLASMLDEDLSGHFSWPSGWTVVTGEVEHWNTVTVTNYVTVTNHVWPAYSWTNLIINRPITNN